MSVARSRGLRATLDEFKEFCKIHKYVSYTKVRIMDMRLAPSGLLPLPQCLTPSARAAYLPRELYVLLALISFYYLPHSYSI